MTTEQKIVTVAEIATLARTRLQDIPSGDDEGALALASSHPNVDTARMFTKAARAAFGEAEMTYYPLAYLRTSPRRKMLLAEASRLQVFPEDCDLYTIITPYDHHGTLMHAVRWDEMAWYVRELLSVNALPDYLLPLNNVATWWHFPHGIDGEPGMISYIPSHAYGKQHRRVKTKLGKYLKQFFGDQMDDLKIRDVVNFETTGGIELHDDPKEFLQAYKGGPNSCMAGERGWPDDSHPVLCYALSGEFKMAVIRKGPGENNVLSRAIVHWPTKQVVRLYGDGDRLLAALKRLHNVTKVDAYQPGTKLAYIKAPQQDGARDNRVRLPYIDGGERGVAFVPATDNMPEHWRIVDSDEPYDINASDASCTFTHERPDTPCAVCGALKRKQNLVLRYSDETLQPVCPEHLPPDSYGYLHVYDESYGTNPEFHGMDVMAARNDPDIAHLYDDGSAPVLTKQGFGSRFNRAEYVVVRGNKLHPAGRTFEFNGELHPVTPNWNDPVAPWRGHVNDLAAAYGSASAQDELIDLTTAITPDWLIAPAADSIYGVCIDTDENRRHLGDAFDKPIPRDADMRDSQYRAAMYFGGEYTRPNRPVLMTIRQMLSVMSDLDIVRWIEDEISLVGSSGRKTSAATLQRVLERCRAEIAAEADTASAIGQSEVAA